MARPFRKVVDTMSIGGIKIEDIINEHIADTYSVVRDRVDSANAHASKFAGISLGVELLKDVRCEYYNDVTLCGKVVVGTRSYAC